MMPPTRGGNKWNMSKLSSIQAWLKVKMALLELKAKPGNHSIFFQKKYDVQFKKVPSSKKFHKIYFLYIIFVCEVFLLFFINILKFCSYSINMS